MPRKWIAKRIAELDPETDYDEIWKLGSAHRPNDFMMNLVYAVTFPHFFVREHDAAPLIDDGAGGILTRPDRRSDATSWKMQVWWHYGSQHEETRNNVEALNRLHAFHARKYPESGFAHNDSYLYTLCYEAAGMHRLLQRVGLPGISTNEQLAAVPYWRQMSTLFRNVVTGEPVTGFPDSFAGIMDYMDRYEAQDVPKHEFGPVAARAIIQQFADRYFPKPLHPAVRAWVVSLYPDHLPVAYSLKLPPRPVVAVFRLLTAGLFLVGEKVIPDPTDTFTERREAARNKDAANGVTAADDPAVHEAAYQAVQGAGCPHPSGRRQAAQAGAAVGLSH